MYIDLKDFNSPWGGYQESGWKYFNITPQDCRRRKDSRHWTDLDILLPEVKEEMFFSRSNIHLHLSDFDYWDELFTAVTYTRYAMPDDGGERFAYHRIFCTDDELIGFMRLRYPRESKDPAAVREIQTLLRNDEYRDYKTGVLSPNIDIPEPFKTRLYSGEFDEPWTPIYF